MMSMKKGEMMVEVVGTQATSHIKNLVQNTGKKKVAGGGGGGGGWSSQSKTFRGSFPGSFPGSYPGSYPWARPSPASPRQKSRQSQAAVNTQAGLGFKARKQKLSLKPSQLKPGAGRSSLPSPWSDSAKVVLKVSEKSVKVWGDQVLDILRSNQWGGLAQDQVEKLFEAKYRETLPLMWTKTLTQAGLIDLKEENRLNKSPLVIPAKIRKVEHFGFNSTGDSRFRFSELIKDQLEEVEERRSDVLPDVEKKLKQLNITGIRPMSEGWVGGEAKSPQLQLQLQSQSLPEEGEFYDCKVSHVVSPGEIYVQAYSSLGKYQNMNKLISAFYKLNGGMAVKNPEPGRFLLPLHLSSFLSPLYLRHVSGRQS